MSKKKDIELRLPLWQIEILKVRADRIGVPLNQFIVYVLMRHMDEQLNSASSSSSSAPPC